MHDTLMPSLSFSQSQGSLRKISGTKYWEVTEPFIWYIDYYDHKK